MISCALSDSSHYVSNNNNQYSQIYMKTTATIFLFWWLSYMNFHSVNNLSPNDWMRKQLGSLGNNWFKIIRVLNFYCGFLPFCFNFSRITACIEVTKEMVSLLFICAGMFISSIHKIILCFRLWSQNYNHVALLTEIAL